MSGHKNIYQAALEYHANKPSGKIETIPSKSVRNAKDLELAYSPGVAAPALAIAQNPNNSYLYTSRANLVGVISNGTAVLGLGAIGPHAAKPVMEGKAILFKALAGIDSFDIELDTENVEEMIQIIKALEPTFGGINLEDIRSPDCFEIESRLEESMNIPVFHDDQHGTAIVVSAALMNAIELTGRDLSRSKIVINGAGAAGLASARLLVDLGVPKSSITLCDINGVVNHKRRDQLHKWLLPFASNTSHTKLEECIQGADVIIGLSVKGAITQDMIASMTPRPIVFAMANPDPEIEPEDVWNIAPEAIVCTGRSDDPNQVNNILAFPYIFRGALDVHASKITPNMKKAAVMALVSLARSKKDFGPKNILPSPFDPELKDYISKAVSKAAIKDNVNRILPELPSAIVEHKPPSNNSIGFHPHSRVEKDLIGSINVPSDRYFGAQTMRALRNFPITNTNISDMPEFITAFAWVKKAAAVTNNTASTLSDDKTRVIKQCCDEILAGRLRHEFVVDVIQGGAGTSSNMNVNEVIANRGLELLGRSRGDYTHLHPNDDVNQSQSTNDAYATAIRLTMVQLCDQLIEELALNSQAFENKAIEFKDIKKLGRTQMQDAVPMTLGQEFGAFANTLSEDISRLEDVRKLFLEVNMGGTAIGTGMGANEIYQKLIVPNLKVASGLDVTRAADRIEATWDTGAFVMMSGVIKRLATKYSKISNDLRLLSSGPRSGIGEILLPEVQPGSSIMPGKVNPVIPEVMNQVCFKVFGADTTVTFAAEAGQLQLNAMEPIMTWAIYDSCKSLIAAMQTFRANCIIGIKADPERCASNLQNSTAYVTALVPLIGYKKATKVAVIMLKEKMPLSEALARTFPEDGAEIFNQVVLTY